MPDAAVRATDFVRRVHKLSMRTVVDCDTDLGIWLQESNDLDDDDGWREPDTRR